MPSISGYPDWCERCGWNLEEPPRLSFHEGRFAHFADALGRRSGERLARESRSAPGLRRPWSAARALAYAIAFGVLVLDLALVAGGVAAIVTEFPDVVSIVFGVAMISVGVVMRPRVWQLDRGVVLEPAHAPVLHELVRRIAETVHVPAPDGIVVTADWNAAWAVVGVRRRRVLMIGLPLFACLEPQQRVALIAHEAGHERIGRATLDFVLWSSVSALDRVSDVLRPPREPAPMEAGLAPVEWLARGLAAIVALPVDAVLWLQARLLLRDMQRSEYLADAHAASVAGAAAVIDVHERLLQHPTFDLAVQRAAIDGSGHDVIARVRETMRTVPERERERHRRVARLQHTRLTDTHPPTGTRIELLQQRGPAPAAVTLDACDLHAHRRRARAARGRAGPGAGRSLSERPIFRLTGPVFPAVALSELSATL